MSVLTLILGGGAGSRLSILDEKRAQAASHELLVNVPRLISVLLPAEAGSL